MLNCYGSRNEPKFTHLSHLHHAIAAVAPSLLAQQQPITVPLTTLEDAEGTRMAAGSLVDGERAKCNAAGVLSWATHPGACVGLSYDKKSTNEHDCAIACCEDPSCALWQFDEAQDHGCWRGKPSGCQTAPLKKASGVRPGAKLPPDHPGSASPYVAASVYNSTAQEVVILSNLVDTGQPNGPKTAAAGATVRWGGESYHICAGSSLLLSGGKLIFNTSIDSDGPETQTTPATLTTDNAHDIEALEWKAWREPIVKRRGFDASVDKNGTTPTDQVHVTDDLTDYMWYSTSVELQAGRQQLELTTGIGSAFLVYLDGAFVGADDDHTHTGSHGATRADARGNMSFPFTATAGTHRLDLLSVSMGINNWLGVEDNWKGLLAGSAARGKLRLVDNATGSVLKDLTSNGWLMQPYLEGQRRSLQSGGVPPTPWVPTTTSALGQTLTWFSTEFATPQGSAPLVLDILGLGRGHAYVNSFDIGRYYNVTGTPCEQCTCAGDSCCMKVRDPLTLPQQQQQPRPPFSA